MPKNKRFLTGAGIIAAIAIVFLLFNSATPFSIVGTIVSFPFTQSGLYGGASPDESLTSGSFSFSSPAPSYTCVNYNGQIVDPSQLSSTQNIALRCAAPDTITVTVMLNGVAHALIKDVPTELDAYVTVTYLGSTVASNNAEGIPTSWSNNFDMSIDTGFLSVVFPQDDPATIAPIQTFVGNAQITNNYTAVQGTITIQQSSQLVFIGTTISTLEQDFPLGTTDISFTVETQELGGREVEIIPSVHFFKGDRFAFAIENPSRTKTYQVSPGGVSRSVLPSSGRTVIVIPPNEQNFFQKLWNSITHFFGGLFS